MKRGEVYFVDLGENIGGEENKIRPVVVLQADAYNFKSPVFTSAIISSSSITIPDIQIPAKFYSVVIDLAIYRQALTLVRAFYISLGNVPLIHVVFFMHLHTLKYVYKCIKCFTKE